MNTPTKSLDEAVIDALELHGSYELPHLKFGPAQRRLVIGSGNAFQAGKIIFKDEDAVFADEGQYLRTLEKIPLIDGAVVISASGKKHAPIIVQDLIRHGLQPYLLTCDRASPAAQLLPPDRVFETRCLPEPITYNTSTYLGMILAKTREDPHEIRRHIEEKVGPLAAASDLARFTAFYLIVEARFDPVREMFLTKFDELFGPNLNGRCYTPEQTLHAKTLVPSDTELFISFGYHNRHFGSVNARLNIPLFPGAREGALVAIGYYAIGRIQAIQPGEWQWFRRHAAEYEKLQPAFFEQVARQHG